jgi:catechol 2,3-dioxygenase-like lactoylglutathione lyase family enzyme
MFDHVTIRASDRDASERFYDTVLVPIGIEKTHSDGHFAEWGNFSVAQSSAERPVTRRLHIAFVVPSREHVDDFWRVGTEAGYPDDGPPGPRPQYTPGYYGSFLLDPDGNSAEAVHHEERRCGPIDHLWIRVADLVASKRFYETVAPDTGFRLTDETDDRGTFTGADGSFSVVSGTPTEHVHMAFPADENAAVDEFHRRAVVAGYADNGAPGERPVYHPGYYGAFVLDPDGNNVEVVNHNRGVTASFPAP